MSNYNIALIPENKTPFIDFAQSNFANLLAIDKKKDQLFKTPHVSYLLGKNSIPHISLCQFQCEKNKLEIILQACTHALSKRYYC
jgi:hypothetical protein